MRRQFSSIENLKEFDINKLTFADDIYVLWVNYHVGTNELLIIMHSDPVFQN